MTIFKDSPKGTEDCEYYEVCTKSPKHFEVAMRCKTCKHNKIKWNFYEPIETTGSVFKSVSDKFVTEFLTQKNYSKNWAGATTLEDYSYWLILRLRVDDMLSELGKIPPSTGWQYPVGGKGAQTTSTEEKKETQS